MGAPHLDDDIEKAILETYSYLKRKLKDEPSGKEVRSELVKRLGQKDAAEARIPKLRTIQQRLKKARAREREFLSRSEVDETEAWSTLTLSKLSLPPESMPSVLQQWRYALSLDLVFTIRQAKWVSILYPLFKGNDVAELWFASHRYTTQEELSILRDDPMQIYDMDSRLAMGDWERYTAKLTAIEEQSRPSVYHILIPWARDGGIAEECISALPSFDLDVDNPDLEKWDLMLDTERLVKELPASSKCFPDFETRLVYLRHLSYIAKMPKWSTFTLKPEEIIDIILDLRKWVLDLKQNIDKEKTRAISENSSWEDYRYDEFKVLYEPHRKVHGILLNIYKRAGYVEKGGGQ